ncbi:MAG TPA: Ig-like domain-containing protein, partial [Candidatus Dojkabacteria bacterium]|nr:Ig-like domain-containing protein [Candidatus Dojkabacteria bacterium]
LFSMLANTLAPLAAVVPSRVYAEDTSASEEEIVVENKEGSASGEEADTEETADGQDPTVEEDKNEDEKTKEDDAKASDTGENKLEENGNEIENENSGEDEDVVDPEAPDIIEGGGVSDYRPIADIEDNETVEVDDIPMPVKGVATESSGTEPAPVPSDTEPITTIEISKTEPSPIVGEPIVAENSAPSENIEPETPAVKVEEKEYEYLEDGIEVVDTVDENWELNEEGFYETEEKVKIGIRYVFPENEKVTVTFKKLPASDDDRSTLRMKEVNPEDLPEELKDSNVYAVDITTDMEDGDFEYDLTLPKAEKSKAEVSYMEDLDSEVKSVGKEDGASVSQKEDSDLVEIEDLGHMTVFVVVNPLPSDVGNGGSCTVASISGTCYDTIQKAIDAANPNGGDTIKLLSDFTITQQININKSLTLDGNNHTIFSNFTETGSNNNSAIGISATNNVTLKNLTVKSSRLLIKPHGINVYKATDVVLENVTLKDNNVGLIVNGSKVEVKDITTSSNGLQGINVDQGVGVSEPAILTVLGTSSHNELSPIYIDDIRKNVMVIPNNQYYYVDLSYSRAYRLDKTPPSVPVLESPIWGTRINNNNPTMQWKDSTDFGTGVSGYYLEMYSNCTNINNVSTCQPVYSNTTGELLVSSDYQASTLPENTYFWRVKAVDKADNESNWSNLWKFTIDTPPVFSLLGILENGVLKTVVQDRYITNWNTPVFVGDLTSTDIASVKVFINETEKSTATINNMAWEATISNPLSDGSYNVKIIATDLIGNTTTIEKELTIDTVAPSKPNITNTPNNAFTNINAITVNWQGGDDQGTNPSGIKGYIIRYVFTSANGNTVTDWTSGLVEVGNPKTHSGTYGHGEGKYVIYLKTVDNAGNESPESEPYTITYDKTKPTIKILEPAENSSHSGSFNIKVQGTDESSGLGQFVINIKDSQGNNIGTCLNENENGKLEHTATCTINTSSYPNGQYSIRTNVKDRAGNMSDTLSRSFIFDNEKPSGDILGIRYPGGDVQNFITNDNTPILYGTCADNNGILNVGIKIDEDTSSNQTPVCNNGSWVSSELSSLADGVHTITLTITDLAGNTTTIEKELFIDTLAPFATHTYYKNGIAITDSKTYVKSVSELSFKATYTDNSPSSGMLKDSYVIFDSNAEGTARTSKAYCGWRNPDNTLIITTNPLEEFVPFTNCEPTLADGQYYMYHQVYDNATRKDIPSITQYRDVKGLYFIVDTSTPSSTITSPDNSGTDSVIYSNSWDGKIAGTAQDSLSGVKEVQLTIQKTDGQYWSGSTWQEGKTSVTAQGTTNWIYQIGATLTNDTYTIKSHATDNAGNTENSYTITIVLDKTIPEVSISLDPENPDGSNGWYKNKPKITLTATDANSDKVEYQWGSNTGSWTTYTSPFKPDSEGKLVLYYRSIDKAGNESV